MVVLRPQVLFWSVLKDSSLAVPLQAAPAQVCLVLSASVIKHYLCAHALLLRSAGGGDGGGGGDSGAGGHPAAGPFQFPGHGGRALYVVFCPPLLWAGGALLFYLLLFLATLTLRALTTRYQSGCAFAAFVLVVGGLTWAPFETLWVNFWAVHRYLWGDSSFVVTGRSSAAVDCGGRERPKSSSRADSDTTPLLGSPTAVYNDEGGVDV